MIPFPVNPEVEDAATGSSKTDWREELRERVQQIRARRQAAGLPEGALAQQPSSPAQPPESPPLNPIVEAAINRVWRRQVAEGQDAAAGSSEKVVEEEMRSRLRSNAERSTRTTDSVPRVEPPSSQSQTLSAQMSAPRAQTQPSGNPAVASRSRAESSVAPLQSALAAAVLPDSDVGPSAPRQSNRPSTPARSGESSTRVLTQPADGPTPAQSKTHLDAKTVGRSRDPGLDEFDDDLDLDEIDFNDEPFYSPAAEDELLDAWAQNPTSHSSPERIQTASFMQRLRAGIVDGLVLLLAVIPFAALIERSQGDFANRRIQLALLAIILIMHLFYTTMMLVAAGRTIGMMVAGILAVHARTMNLPSLTQSFGRAVGYLLAAAPAGLGFFYPMLDPQGRSLSDLISRTTVKQLSRDVGEVRASWLYHHGRS